jgi:hypothetical protein
MRRSRESLETKDGMSKVYLLKTRVTRCGRICTRCKIWKPWESFCLDSSGVNQRHATCKSCCSELSAAWKTRTNYYQVNRARILRQKKETYSPARKRDYDLWRNYGINSKEFDRLYRQQRRRCAICDTYIRRTFNARFRGREAVVDHNHLTGRLRGLLCHRCNRALGLLHDDNVLLKRALHYVQ